MSVLAWVANFNSSPSTNCSLQNSVLSNQKCQKVDFSCCSVVMAQSEWNSTCCNPFNVRGYNSKQKNLRPVVSRWMCEKAPHISISACICDSCRKKLSRAFIPDVHVESADTNSDSDAEDTSLQQPSPLEDSSTQPSVFEEDTHRSSTDILNFASLTRSFLFI